jgi:hypothetical protein
MIMTRRGVVVFTGSSLEGVQIATRPTAPLEMELAAMLREKGDSAGKPVSFTVNYYSVGCLFYNLQRIAK